MEHWSNLAVRDGPLILSSPSLVPFTTSSLTANFICRVLLAICGNLVCLVPLRLLYRNGEFAATVFILNMEAKNLQTIMNTLIWRNDDVDSWWQGQGVCDVSPYVHNFTLALYSTCMLAIMRNLAHQVCLQRANPYTAMEKRKRNLLQALIILPLPILQVCLTWPLTSQRYAIGTLVGCAWVPYPSWVYLVFFILPQVILAMTTTVYSVLTYVRFRQASKSTHSATSCNRLSSQRAQRTKRRLYLMVVSILTPFLPIVLVLAALNIIDMQKPLAFDYDAIHNHQSPYPWNTIIYLNSQELGFGLLNNAWISILTAIPVFVFFGMTKGALNDYRKVLVSLGLGRIHPALYKEYDPDRALFESGSYATGGSSSSKSTTKKAKSGVSSHIFDTLSTTSADSCYRSTSIGVNDSTVTRPGLCLSPPQNVARPNTIWENGTGSDTLPHRNPFLFRTRLDLPVLDRLPIFRLFDKKRRSKEPSPELGIPLRDEQPATGTGPFAHSDSVQTKVWSQDIFPLLDHRVSEVGRGVMVQTSLVTESKPVNRQQI